MNTEPPGIGAAGNDVAQRIRMMKLIHLALVAGVLLFAGFVYVQVRDRMTCELRFSNPVFLVAAALVATNMALAMNLKNIMLRQAALGKANVVTVQRYQVFFIARSAMLEGAALFCAAAVLATKSIMPAILLVLCVAVLIAKGPSVDEFQAMGGRAR